MLLLKIVLTFLVVLNLMFLLFANYNTRRITTTASISLEEIPPHITHKKYMFKDPILAYQILQKLDILEPEFNKTFITKPFLGLIAEDNYCDKHRAYFAANPEYVFTEKNHITSYSSPSGFRKTVLGVMGKNVMPEVKLFDDRVRQEANPQPLALDLSMIITHVEMYYYRTIMNQYSCLGQVSNHIPGHDSLYRKDLASIALLEYSKQYKNREHCFNLDKFYPKTYTMRDPEQCRDFFNIFNSKKYQDLKKERDIVYFRKIGAEVHAAYGVFPVDSNEEQYIRILYENGDKCGKVRENNLMQYFVHNPMLLYGRKFDFRLFMLIASSNPFIVYYHDGIIRVSLTPYDTKGNLTNTLMPNGHVNDEIIEKAKNEGTYMGKTEAEMTNDYIWNFEKLKNYLYVHGVISDPNWLDNYLRPKIKVAMVHLIRMSQKGFYKISSVFELFGLDFMLDEEMNLWFVEGNCRPAIESLNEELKEFFTEMFKDQYDIAFALLRSRMKRVYNYVNNIIISEQVIRTSENEIELIDYATRLAEFKAISQNHFDPEFEIHTPNSFTKIIDENYQGTVRYSNLLSEDCL